MSKKISLSEKLFGKTMPITETGCWIWLGAVSNHGYGNMGIYMEGAYKFIQPHRAAWELMNGEIPEGMYVCHKCDQPLCIRPDHLFLGTPKDNSKDMQSKGRARYWGNDCKDIYS